LWGSGEEKGKKAPHLTTEFTHAQTFLCIRAKESVREDLNVDVVEGKGKRTGFVRQRKKQEPKRAGKGGAFPGPNKVESRNRSGRLATRAEDCPETVFIVRKKKG